MKRKICNKTQIRPLFWLCWMVYMVSCLGRYNYLAVIAELVTREGFTKAGAGMVGTALFVVYGVCQIVTGIAGDRIAPRKVLLFGLCGSAAVNGVMGCVSGQAVMLVLWGLNGVFQACMWSPVARIFAEMLPEESRKKACSDAAATIPVANVLVYFMAALCIRHLHWRFAFWIPAVLIACAAVVWQIGMKRMQKAVETHGEEEILPVSQQAGAVSGSFLALIGASGAVFAAVAALSHGLLKDGIQSWLPTFLTDQFAFATDASAAAAIVLPVFSILGVFLTRWLADRHIRNELRGAGAFFAVAACSLGLLCAVGTGNSLFALIMLTAASTSMIGANILLINLIPMRFGRVGRTSTMTGFLNCHAYAGSAVSSFGVGAAVDVWGWNAAIYIWLGFALLALGASFLGAKRWSAYSARL